MSINTNHLAKVDSVAITTHAKRRGDERLRDLRTSSLRRLAKKAQDNGCVVKDTEFSTKYRLKDKIFVVAKNEEVLITTARSNKSKPEHYYRAGKRMAYRNKGMKEI